MFDYFVNKLMFVYCVSSHSALTSVRVRTDRVHGNQVHSITVEGLGITKTNFQQIALRFKF